MALHARHDKRDSHGTCSVASPQRGLAGVDMSTSLFPEVVPDIDATSEHKKTKFNCTRERYCFFVVRHDGTGTERHARQTRHARHDARYRHDTPTSGIWA